VRAARHAFLTYLVVALLVAVLVRIDVTLPGVGHLGSALVAMTFLYAPVVMASIRKEDLEAYGLTWQPVKLSLLVSGIALSIIIPVFVVGYFGFYELACNREPNFLTMLTPRGECRRYGGLATLHAPRLGLGLLEFCAIQFVVVALPEELFFRGYVLTLLEKRYPPTRQLWGGKIGIALLLTSVMFALVHLPRAGDPSALATFFPALLFGWMKSRTGSLLAPVITHAMANILIHILTLIAAR